MSSSCALPLFEKLRATQTLQSFERRIVGFHRSLGLPNHMLCLRFNADPHVQAPPTEKDCDKHTHAHTHRVQLPIQVAMPRTASAQHA